MSEVNTMVSVSVTSFHEGHTLTGGRCVQDEQSLLFGGTDAPCAIAQLNSIGSINLSNNRSFSAAFSALISEHGIPEDRFVAVYASCVPHDRLELYHAVKK